MNNFPIQTTEHRKIRVGRNNDGGYVICDIPSIQYDLLISGGIKDDISFEEAFLQKYPGVQCFAFDGTIDNIPQTQFPIQFVKKNIGRNSTNTVTNLKEYMVGKNNIFMKMDIEGYERDLFLTLEESDLLKLAQITIEVHFVPAKTVVSTKLKDTHYLVHFHSNNASSKLDSDGIPMFIELTYVRKDLCKNVEPSTYPIPNSELDMKNIVSLPDILYVGGRFIKEPSSHRFNVLTGRVG